MANNRTPVQEKVLELEEQYQPLDEYDLQVGWNKRPPRQSAEIPAPPPKPYEPRRTRTMRSPSPNEWEPKQVLYVAPDWVQDCGVDDLLNQYGYRTARSSHENIPLPHTNDTCNPPNTSTLDMPDIDIFDMDEQDVEEPNEEPNEVEAPLDTVEIEDASAAIEQPDIPMVQCTYKDGWPSGYYFGDGSGGNYSKYPPIRGCGVGVHYVNPGKQPVFDASTPRPGRIQ